jgi:hypothetical protein
LRTISQSESARGHGTSRNSLRRNFSSSEVKPAASEDDAQRVSFVAQLGRCGGEDAAAGTAAPELNDLELFAAALRAAFGMLCRMRDGPRIRRRPAGEVIGSVCGCW